MTHQQHTAFATSRRSSGPRSTSLTKCKASLSPVSVSRSARVSHLHSILTAKKAIKAANVLQLPIYATTQNAARLGPTVTDLEPLLKDNPLVKVSSDKTLFSMWTPELQAAFKKHNQGAKPAVVIVGIESHICVTQSKSNCHERLQYCTDDNNPATLDLLANGHKVYILADGVSSCNREEVPIALARLRAEGAVVTTSESWMYETMGDAGIPEFRNIVGLVKETKDDTQAALKGLLSPKI